jgi:hypothetical protein
MCGRGLCRIDIGDQVLAPSNGRETKGWRGKQLLSTRSVTILTSISDTKWAES